jgi:hypothetical protein
LATIFTKLSNQCEACPPKCGKLLPFLFFLKISQFFGQFFPLKRSLGTDFWFFFGYQIEKIWQKITLTQKDVLMGEKMALFARSLKKFTHH